MADVYSTGRLAREAGVHVETVRYYERLGLLTAPRRRPSGYRDYGPTDLERLRSIVRLKEFGFTLKEIRQLLDECADADATCGNLQVHFRSKLQQLRQEIMVLEARCQTIERAVSMCVPGTLVEDCPERIANAGNGHDARAARRTSEN